MAYDWKNISLIFGKILWQDKYGIHYLFRFPNGYGASVVKAYGCQGFENDRWELACTLYETERPAVVDPDEEYVLTYPYTIMHGSDVLGNLKDKDVRRILYKIAKLGGS